MTTPRHLSLFHPRLVRERAETLDRGEFKKHERAIGVWLDHLKSGALNDTKEVSLHGGFLERVFGDVLGYRTMATATGGHWDLVAEKSLLEGGSADGAIGYFEKGHQRVVAPIELKGAAQFLDHAKSRSLTPIQQGWDYANRTPESRWIIVSNYRETRLFAKSRGPGAYELFHLEELGEEAGFLRFAALLGRDALLGGPSANEAPLAHMLLASERTEREITEKLYADYRGIRARLFDELRRRHSNMLPGDLLADAQTILDRVLFVAFAEDRQLLPPATLARAYEHRDPYSRRPIWQNFLAVFRSIDKGNPDLNIAAYNGGLFRDLEGVEQLEVSDEMCASFKALGEYNFAEEVSVDVLGHIFEQSIADLEQLRKDAASTDSVPPPDVAASTQKKPSKRKAEGIFYTPAFVTSFLVRETLGRAISEAWQAAGPDRATKKADRIAAWEAYQAGLRKIHVLDPACGSGAFLAAAFDALAHEFERANRALAELRGQQTSLFDLTKTILNENLFGLDQSAESVEISKLSLWLKTAERGKKLTFLDCNIRQGNTVVSDPLVDSLAFDWGAGRVARNVFDLEAPPGEDVAEYDARWREGFDVVIGNPPYVRQELLTRYKEHWSETFRAYDGTADLFVYFFERGIKQLKPGGRLGFIVSNKWLRGGYAEGLRDLLARECTIESIVDFGHAPIFPDADAFPCIITLRKALPPEGHEIAVTLYPREELGKELLASYVESHRFPLVQRSLPKEGWTLEPPEVQALIAKMRRNGVPLREYAKVKPFYGIKTGCNEAFLVDQATKDRLCREDPRSADVLKKYLRGQDVSRWAPEWAHLWLLLIKSSNDQEWPWSSLPERAAEERFAAEFPALHRHLKPLEATLRKRTDRGRFWWELRTCAYYAAFEQPKLVYQVIQFHPQYALDRAGFYTNDKAYFLGTDDAWLLATLNSPAMWWHNWRHFVHMKDEALNPSTDKIGVLPIPRPTGAQLSIVTPAVASIVELVQAAAAGVAATLDLLRIEHGIDTPGNALSDFSSLDSDAFVKEVKKRRPKGAVRLNPTTLGELRALFENEAPPIRERRARILELERSIADVVHEAFGLDAADLALMRETAPPRMPPGWDHASGSVDAVRAASADGTVEERSTRIKDLLEAGDVDEARRLAPGTTWERVLALPTVTVGGPPARPGDEAATRATYAWLSDPAHVERYRGNWVALRAGELVAADPEHDRVRDIVRAAPDRRGVLVVWVQP